MREFHHIPVLLNEVLQVLRPAPGKVMVDGTLGGGGHAANLLERVLPGGFLWGCDQDRAALRAARAKLENIEESAGHFEIREMNFAQLGSWVPAGSCDGVLLDLGVSSHQLDTPERGFSFLHDGPLDMRMSQSAPLKADDVVNEWAEADLARAFWELGGEPDSRRLARVIVRERAVRRFETTKQLAETIEKASPRAGRKAHPATRIFQAIRIVVNREMEFLEAGLNAAFACLRPGGRLAVLTFHSLEDRLVKSFIREQTREYTLPPGQPDDPLLRRPRVPEAVVVHRQAIAPSDAEVRANPRARSAQLRTLERTAMNVGSGASKRDEESNTPC